MGTLSPPFILCPLSDRKELLGMSEDRLQNKVIITIGRNIAIRYHILEQKQETSWTISRHWLTSRVVYCSELEKYGAVVDNTAVALWDEGDTVLDRFKKHKFNEAVFELRPTGTLGTLVIFENGFVTSLNRATGDRNIADGRGVVDMKTEIILDLEVNEREEKVVLVIAPKTGDKKLYRHIQKRKNLKVVIVKLSFANSESESKSTPLAAKPIEVESQIDISQNKLDIVGHCILVGEETSLVYLCSDGKLYQQLLAPKSTTTETKTTIGYLGKNVSVNTPVVMKLVEDGASLIIYGSDPSEEGAVVFLYDVKYDLVIAKQSLKLYGTPPIMERIGGSVIVPVGMHILVLGFRASKSLLSSVVGKHQIRSGAEVFEERTPWTVSAPEWDVDKETVIKPVSRNHKKKMKNENKKETALVKQTFPEFWEIVQQFKILEREGQPESSICNQVIPMALEQNNLAALDWILEAFTDIPESYLITILSYLLSQLAEPALIKKKTPVSPTKASSSEEATEKVAEINVELVYSPDSRINRLILRSFDEKELIRNLPSLDYERVRLLMRYLKSMMDQFWPSPAAATDAGNEEDEVEGDASCWMKWISAVLDAHYPKFVLNNEITLIEEMLGILEERTKVMDAIEDLEPYLLLTYNKVKFEPIPNPNSKWRSEIITFV